MSIDISSCQRAITKLKNNINNAFKACADKNSTFEGAYISDNLVPAINAIPQGTTSESIEGGSFGGFNVTWAEAYEDDEGRLVYPEEFTISFGSVGVTWKSICIYSDTNDGFFTITKISGNRCIISAHVFNRYDQEDATGVIDISGNAHSYRANYTISGNSITFTNSPFPNAGFVGGSDNQFRSTPQQVDVETYFSTYPLEKINIVA